MNQGAAIGKERYGRWNYRTECSGGDEEMEREQMTEAEQFEYKSKDESGAYGYREIRP